VNGDPSGYPASQAVVTRSWSMWWEDTWRGAAARLFGPRWLFSDALWSLFSDFCADWMVGWKDEVEQPDRLKLLRDLGLNPLAWHLLRGLYRFGSLQRAVAITLECDDDLAHEVASNITQIAHASFPDIAGTYDHSSRWRRSWK